MLNRLIAVLGVGILLGAGVSCRLGEVSTTGKTQRKTDAHPDTARGAVLLYGLEGSKVDRSEALSCLTRAANAGDSLALYYQAMAVTLGYGLNAPDPLRGRRLATRAYPILRDYAKNGSMESLYAVGELCASGMIDEAGWQDAEPIFEYCVKENFAPASRALGIHALNEGNAPEAVTHLRCAAAADDATAEYYLALALEQTGAKAEAQEHLSIAARRGVPEAMYLVAQRSANSEDGARWRERAAMAGVAAAQYEMAQPLLADNPEKAREWLELATRRDYAPAMKELAKGTRMRHFDIDQMVLLLLAQKNGVDVTRELHDANLQSGLELPVRYSTMELVHSGAQYDLLNREIQIIADDYIGGNRMTAQNEFRELVRLRKAVLPASLIWYTFYQRNLPLNWLIENPGSSDVLGMAIVAGIAGNGAAQVRYAEQLSAKEERDPARKQMAKSFAAVLSANGEAQSDEVDAARARLQEQPFSGSDRDAWIEFIRHFAPALCRNPQLPAEWLQCAPENFADAPAVVFQQPF